MQARMTGNYSPRRQRGCITVVLKWMFCRVKKGVRAMEFLFHPQTPVIAEEADPEQLLLWILRLDFLLYLWLDVAFEFPVRPLRSFSLLGFLTANGNVYRTDANGSFYFGA